MRLMFVASSDGYNGENGDLFVWACTKDVAVDLWREEYDLEPTDEPDRVFDVPTVPNHPTPHAFSWHKDVTEL